MIYEHRIYTVLPGKAEEEVDRLTKWAPVIEKHGAKIVAGIFQTVIGDSNQVSCIIAYNDLAHCQKVWESLVEDEEFKRQRDGWIKGGPVNSNFRRNFLSSTEYPSSK